MHKTPFVLGEFYHIYNQGVDKRNIFGDQFDLDRFTQSIRHFNCLEPIGSIYEKSFEKESARQKPLVRLVSYILNPNHYHLILEPRIEKGIEKFIHRLATGYTNYFNEKYHRRGSLFQGTYKSKHVNNNEYLLHLSVYINLNHKVHRLSPSALTQSSWEEYVSRSDKPLCDSKIILSQFSSPLAYRSFAEDGLSEIIKNKIDQNEEEFEPIATLGS